MFLIVINESNNWKHPEDNNGKIYTGILCQAQGDDFRPRDLQKRKWEACKAHSSFKDRFSTESLSHLNCVEANQENSTVMHKESRLTPLCMLGTSVTCGVSPSWRKLCHFCILFYLGRSGESDRVVHSPASNSLCYWGEPRTPYLSASVSQVLGSQACMTVSSCL